MTDVLAAPLTAAEMESGLARHRAHLTGYCYRMLGSPFEADDAVQEALTRAWRSRDGFEGRSSLRSWLFGIATNVCFDMLNARRRRALPVDLMPPSAGDAPLGGTLPEDRWVGPIPDARVMPATTDPAELAVARESIRLAFVAALQHLTARQRAVLILRDVLRWRASEVAALLDCSTTSVNSVLRRARAVLAEAHRAEPEPRHEAEAVARSSHRLDGDDDQRAVVERYAAAFERYDMNELVALLHEDVTLSMPPYTFWAQGIESVATWFRVSPAACRGASTVATSANGCPALAFYKPDDVGKLALVGIQVLEVAEGRVIGLHAFLDPALGPLFDVPAALAT